MTSVHCQVVRTIHTAIKQRHIHFQTAHHIDAKSNVQFQLREKAGGHSVAAEALEARSASKLPVPPYNDTIMSASTP